MKTASDLLLMRRFVSERIAMLLFFFLTMVSSVCDAENVKEEWVARYSKTGIGEGEASALTLDDASNVYVTGHSITPGFKAGYATFKYDANGNELWVAMYFGTGESGEATALAVDAVGNVYVTGESDGAGTGSDFATIKYDVNGNQLWADRYNGTGNGSDRANAIAVDAAGDVYVIGHSEEVSTNRDFTTIKYDTQGNRLWLATYNGTLYSEDNPNAIVVDAAGNVYVTGESEGTGTAADYATFKYDTNGTQLWATRYNGLGNGDDAASALAVDAGGNVYVTGQSEGAGTAADYATIKYDTDGTQLWVARYNGIGNGYDKATAIAVDAAGNVYVTGESEGAGTAADYATIKYDTNGTQLWVVRYNGTGNDYDRAPSIAVDASGNVYVAGESKGEDASYDYATVKYDANGNLLWVGRYNGTGNGYDKATAIAVDASGNVYVTGESEGEDTSYDYATVKYDANGNLLWVSRYNGTGNGYDIANGIVVDTAGNVYVTGESEGEDTSYDYATVKYDANGSQLWAARHSGAGNGGDQARAIAVDAVGNVYVTGIEGEDTAADYATFKYDTNGNQLWVAKYSGGGNGFDGALAIAVDVAGNVHVTGASIGVGTGFDYATFKYDTNGKQLWVARYSGGGNGFDEARAIAVDAAGNVYVTGTIGAQLQSFSDYATLKYDANGNQLWVATYNGTHNNNDMATAMAVDVEGHVYVTGGSRGAGTTWDYATVKYDTNGSQLWVARYNGTGNDDDVATAIAVDSAGNVYVTGSSWSSNGLFDYATIKYDSDGNQLWMDRYSGAQNLYDITASIAVDSAGNVYITGGIKNRDTINGTIVNSDYNTVKYDTIGNLLWVTRYNGTGNGYDKATAISVDSAGNVYVTGESNGAGTGSDFVTIKYNTNAIQDDGFGNTHDGGNGDFCFIATAANRLSIIEKMEALFLHSLIGLIICMGLKKVLHQSRPEVQDLSSPPVMN